MRIDPEFAGLLVVVGFLMMGFVTMPILLLAAVPVGIGVALLLRLSRKE